jgi:rhodanese-related sulfurtransferase/DNA-binding transcriptional ArsR family regulator
MSSPKHGVFEQLARIGNALSSPVRLEFLELLAQGERSVDELATLTGTTVANTSQHLQKLRQAALIIGRKQGQFVFYRVDSDKVMALLAALARVGEAHDAEIQRLVRLFFFSKDDFEPVPAVELLDRARKGLVTVLDVRPPEEYAAGHVPGAINIPADQLAKRLRELPKRHEVIAYCRGPFCLMSYEAVQLLRKKGIKARRLQDGMPEWRAAGHPVEDSKGAPESNRAR